MAWSLTGLLRLRKLEEDTAAADLAAANFHVRQHEAAQERVRKRLQSLGEVNTDANTLRAIAAARSTSSAMVAELSTLSKIAEADAREAQFAFERAKRNSTTLEKLETRHKQEEAAADLRDEQLALDEIASTRHSSKEAK